MAFYLVAPDLGQLRYRAGLALHEVLARRAKEQGGMPHEARTVGWPGREVGWCSRSGLADNWGEDGRRGTEPAAYSRQATPAG